ncbi:MAG: hypothetical protein E6R04_08825 [Spirochaetes bacterium]|nr:MAG: hypothetical protein E6R04_08825 [Spirochaetota bacterium]
MSRNIPIRIGDLFSLSTITYLIVGFKTSEQDQEFIRLLSPEGKLVWIPNVFGYLDPTPHQSPEEE